MDKQLTGTVFNVRPDGTRETQYYYDDGTSSPIQVDQGFPPGPNDIIHSETIVNKDGSVDSFTQYADGRTEGTPLYTDTPFTGNDDGNDGNNNNGDNGGGDNSGGDNGGGDNGGGDNGGGDNGGADNGGGDNGGGDNGGGDSGGGDSGGGDGGGDGGGGDGGGGD